MELAPYYRVYELPWSPTEEIERRFRNVLRIPLLAFAGIPIIIPSLPAPDKTKLKTNEIPERIVKMLIERKPPPPPPPPELPKPEDLKPEKVPEAPKAPPPAPEQGKKDM